MANKKRGVLAGLLVTSAFVAMPLAAMAADEAVTIEVPIYSTKAYGPTRLIAVDVADTVRPGMTIVGGHLLANNLGSAVGTGFGAQLQADFGITPRAELGIGAGLLNTNTAAVTADGKYLFMSEAYAGNPVSLALLANLGVQTGLGASALGTNVKFGLGLPITKSLTQNISVTAVPGLTVSNIGSSFGPAVVAGALGLGLDLGLSDRFRVLVDSNLGFPSTGMMTNSAAGIRYAFTRDFTTDLFVGYDTVSVPSGVMVATPAVGLGGNIRF